MAFQAVHQSHPETVLMLIGEGMEFERIRKLAIELNLTNSVILPGRQSFTSIPNFLATFTIALVSAGSAEGFHYSPLKLREYLATGKAVVAPKAGDLPSLFRHGEDVLLYDAGSVDDLATKMRLLLENHELRIAMEGNAKALFERDGTWVHELKRVCDKLNINY
jgi:glycosyltransferase involved in cell wall biosynthesis